MNRLLILSMLVAMTILSAFVVRRVDAEEPPVQQAAYEHSAEQAIERKSDLTYSPEWPAPPDTGAMLMRLVMGTVVVLGLCVGSLWLGKPWLMKLQTAQSPNSTIQIAGSVALGQRAILYLVKVGDTQLIAGTDVTGLKSLLALPASFKEVLDGAEPSLDALPTVSDPLTNALPIR